MVIASMAKNTLYQFEGSPARRRAGFPQGLEASVQYLKGAGPRKSELLARLGVSTLHDLILYFPRHHEDRRCARRIIDLPLGGKAAVQGTVVKANALRIGKNLVTLRALLRDETGELEAVWFKRFSYQYDVLIHLKKLLSPGRRVSVYGTVEATGTKREMRVEASEDADAGGGLHFNRLVPVYGLTRGLEDRWMREFMWRHVREQASSLRDPLPESLKEKLELPELSWSVNTYHFPGSPEDIQKARRHLALEELLILQLALTWSRQRHKNTPKPKPCRITRRLLTPFKNQLGFEFTSAQKRAINQIFNDMASPQPMNRLLQGDVGSGKTVVAASAMLLAAENDLQSALLAPTEILAQQHGLTLSRWLESLPVTCRLLTGSTPLLERKRILEEAASGACRILVGTHALLEGDVVFKNLGLVIIDEQHRFGVRQRMALGKKNSRPPDVLVMTATPIPRTLALTLYADMDVSVINELPKGRGRVGTFAVTEEETHKRIRRELEQGGQGYYIFPLVEESQELAAKGKCVRAAKREFERLQTEVFKGLTLGLLHGQMSPREKAAVMQGFRAGLVQLLVATTVVEVGIDVPNANILAVAHPERFGLAQLHQLRGRIGRGANPGTCLVILSPEEGLLMPSSERLNVFCRVTDGFTLAEEDLRLRGPGEFMGVSQHGEPPFRVANILTDADLISLARAEARELLEMDPDLKETAHHDLAKEMKRKFHRLIDLAKVG
jgi:ATP-dependent DNA helicase RecG